jgi:hypothetical protein
MENSGVTLPVIHEFHIGPVPLVCRPLLIRPQTPILIQIGNGGGMLMRQEITPQGRLGLIGKNHRLQKEPF